MAELTMPAQLPENLEPIWKELSRQVRPRIGSAGMEALCGQVFRLRDAQARIAKDGAVVLDGKGVPGPHPAIAIEKSAGAEIRAWLQKFGSG